MFYGQFVHVKLLNAMFKNINEAFKHFWQRFYTPFCSARDRI